MNEEVDEDLLNHYDELMKQFENKTPYWRKENDISCCYINSNIGYFTLFSFEEKEWAKDIIKKEYGHKVRNRYLPQIYEDKVPIIGVSNGAAGIVKPIKEVQFTKKDNDIQFLNFFDGRIAIDFVDVVSVNFNGITITTADKKEDEVKHDRIINVCKELGILNLLKPNISDKGGFIALIRPVLENEIRG